MKNSEDTQITTKPVSLKKGMTPISLKKLGGGDNLTKIKLVAAWQPKKKSTDDLPEKGFFGKLVSALTPTEVQYEKVDLDISALHFDPDGNSVDTVYYYKKESSDDSCKLSKDDLTGAVGSTKEGKGNETITLDLTKVNPIVKYVVFTLTSYNRILFSDLSYANCTIYNQASGKELGEYNVSKEGRNTAMVLMVFTRIGNNWKLSSPDVTSQHINNPKNFKSVVSTKLMETN